MWIFLNANLISTNVLVKNKIIHYVELVKIIINVIVKNLKNSKNAIQMFINVLKFLEMIQIIINVWLKDMILNVYISK